MLTPPEEQWRAPWGLKKKIFGPEQLIDVGGKLDADAPEPQRKKQRADDTVEPVFFHSMPVIFWTEMLAAFNIVGVIDLCAGEGTCALACYRKNIPYVGITFNDTHSAMLLAHLEKVVLSAMTTDGDTLYNVRFAEALLASKKEVKPKIGKKKVKSPKKPKRSPSEETVKSEPPVSGDEAVA